MASVATGSCSSRQMDRQADERRDDNALSRRSMNDSAPPWGLVITGLAVVGLGIVAWNYFGPDLRRYIKIKRM
jgi:hypothetical protein